MPANCRELIRSSHQQEASSRIAKASGFTIKHAAQQSVKFGSNRKSSEAKKAIERARSRTGRQTNIRLVKLSAIADHSLVEITVEHP